MLSREAAAAMLLFVPRFVVMTVAELLAFAACLVASCGASTNAPMVPWRRWLVRTVVAPCSSVVLATVGVWRVRTVGRPAPGARLVVSNHVCILDGFVFVACLGAPSFVARSEGLAGLPVYGTICRALQLVFVRRTDAKSRAAAAAAILERVASAERGWPPLVVFPEGATSRDGLQPFRPGAFRAGPVQPVAIRYDAGLPADGPPGMISDLLFILGLLARSSTACEVCFLPPCAPTAEQEADPALFAAMVRADLEATLRERTSTHPLTRSWA